MTKIVLYYQIMLNYLGDARALYVGNEGLWKKIILAYNVILCLFSFGTFVACLLMFRYDS